MPLINPDRIGLSLLKIFIVEFILLGIILFVLAAI